ncbi:VanW family protein [Prauserella oleivorans]|uniref:VanW family protein n=1 Tax=Prauserella oleivorans TaxID=1478153 RepID=A0ABW5W9V7_9PSEU
MVQENSPPSPEPPDEDRAGSRPQDQPTGPPAESQPAGPAAAASPEQDPADADPATPDPAGTASAEDTGAGSADGDGTAADPAEPAPDGVDAARPDLTARDHEPPARGGRPDTDLPDGAAPQAGRLPDSRLRKAGLVAGAIVGVLALLYGLDLLLNQGDVARGRTVAGVDVGGMSREDAEQTLRADLTTRLTEPVELDAAGTRHTLMPGPLGLRLDWAATLDAATDQPLNPFTRLASFFTTEEIGVVSQADWDLFDDAVQRVRQGVDREAAEGTVRFDGTTPVAQDPRPGRALEVAAAREEILRHWAGPDPVRLPVHTIPVRSTTESVREALDRIARPAVSGPVTVHGEGRDATLRPEAIARALTFEARDDGSLAPKVDRQIIRNAVGPQLAPTERRGRDARFTFPGGRPTIVPARNGRGIDWEKSLSGLTGVLQRTDRREITATYVSQPAALTTEAARALGIKEVIGEFTTSGFAYDSGQNIRAVAREVNGAVVKPGETFSLNGFTGPRGLDQGYVYAGIIENGQPGRAVGGGISQFATTLYNAAYFAAMKDTEHKEHSYYISRYPEGREATVYQNPDGSSVIDLKFTNDAPTGVVIQTIWTPSDITVKLWGTKRYEVESVNGGRFAYTSPSVTVEPIETCSPTSGASGFSTTDTRIIRDLTTGEVVRREKRTVVYNPQPAVVCEEPEPEPEPEPRPKPRPQPSPPPQPDGPPAEQGDVPPGPPADPPGDADGEG